MMISHRKIEPGERFKQALDDIRPKLSDGERKKATSNALEVLDGVVQAYESRFAAGEVGFRGSGTATGGSDPAKTPTGLIYGRIQSGKTRAMILSSALALDNKFRIVVVLTSNINELVGQTQGDFAAGLQGVKVLFKDDIKANSADLEAGHVGDSLEADSSYNLIVVVQKGVKVLPQAAQFLKDIHAERYPAIIFDDEGDQATMDTNTYKRSKTDPAMPPSPIHGLVHAAALSIRQVVPRSVFVSVTGTPNAIFLQNADSDSHAAFVFLLEPGNGYVGGNVFFPDAIADENQYIRLIAGDEGAELLAEGKPIPLGLQQAICSFIVAATAAGMSDLGWKGYKFLCHPSHTTKDHQAVSQLIMNYVGNIIRALRDPNNPASTAIISQLRFEYDDLAATALSMPEFDAIVDEARKYLPYRSFGVINSKNNGRSIPNDQYYNFVIGGNTIGRGLAIKKLLTTYYVREPKTSMMDTMYQHARMFGYREDTISYTRVFMPRQLYDRFHRIYESDEELRQYIRETPTDNGAPLINTVPGIGLKATRNMILDVNQVDVIRPGKQYYPDHPVYTDPDAGRIREKVIGQLAKIFTNYADADKGRVGVDAPVEVAAAILKLIKSQSQNSWSDKQAPDYLRSYAQHYKVDTVRLRYRASNRTARGENGYINGVLSGGEQSEGRALNMPTLWLVMINGNGEGWAGVDFIYPTIVMPNGDTSFIFNKLKS